MDFVKLAQVISGLAVPFFACLCIILKYQPNYYKYEKKDNSVYSAMWACIFHILFFGIFTLWRMRRNNLKAVHNQESAHQISQPTAINYETSQRSKSEN